MARSLLIAIYLLSTIGAVIARATPRDDVAAAIQKLADSGNYAWRTVHGDHAAPPDADFETAPLDGQPNGRFQLEGKVQRDGLAVIRAGDQFSAATCFLRHSRMAIEGRNEGWISQNQFLSRPDSFMEEYVGAAKFVPPPAVEAGEYIQRVSDLGRDGDAYVGEIPEPAAIAMLEDRKRKQNDGCEWRIAEASATVKFWIADGVLTKYQVHWSFDPCISIFGLSGGTAGDTDFVLTTAIASVGQTAIRIPGEARAILDIPDSNPPGHENWVNPEDNRGSRDGVSQDEQQLANDSNGFTVDLYSRLGATPGNLFFSPFSISSALACVYAGARGETAAQMRHVLHFTQPDARLHTAFAWQSDGLNAGGTQDGKVLYQMSVANALWGLQGYPYNPDFIQLLADDYGAGFHQADFAHAAEKASADINQWVEQKTSGRIKDVIGPGMVNVRTRLVLVDAIYFKGNWDGPFDPRQTQQQPFHIDEQKDVSVPLMHRKAFLSGIDDDDLQAVILPYVGNNLEMVILLPKTISGIRTFEEELDSAGLSERLRRAESRQVDLYLPRFKLSNTFGLNDVLSAMGMPDAFSRAADLSGITTADRLDLSFVIHKAYVDVNEEGTEAAAATAIGVAIPTVVYTPPPPMVFRADHPFIFLIRDSTTGAILFMGRVMDPTK